MRMGKLVVILTENSLIEQGFAQTEQLNTAAELLSNPT